MASWLVERRLGQVSSRLRELRAELSMIDEQLDVFTDDAESTAIRALVAETPGAEFEANDARKHAEAMARHRRHVVDTITELEHDLADGNRIVGTWTGFVARDSDGRVRREQPLAAIGALVAQPDSPRLTVIHDPIRSQTLLLDAGTMTVRRIPWSAVAEGRRRRAGDGRRPPIPPGVPVAPPRSTLAASLTEPLGSREIAGVTAQGTRSTYVIPAGQIGNERPLSIISERWTSAELEAVLETFTSDPRTGRTRYRLVEIDRSEPDHLLFEAPAGYTVEDVPPRRLHPAEGPRIR